MALSDYLENKLLDHALMGTAYTPPAGLYLALSTAAFADNGTGTEPGVGGYARQSITFAAANTGAKANDSVVTFATATANWGLIAYAALFDAPTNGNMLFHGALNEAKQINTGDALSLGIGDIIATLD